MPDTTCYVYSFLPHCPVNNNLYYFNYITGVDEHAQARTRDLALGKDISSAMAGIGGSFSDSFDSDIFSTDEVLRIGLDPMDLDGLQMFPTTDPNLAVDPGSDDAFRLDRL